MEEENKAPSAEILAWLNEGVQDEEIDPQIVRTVIDRLKQEWLAEKITARYAYQTGMALVDKRMQEAAVARVERAMKALAFLQEQEANLGP